MLLLLNLPFFAQLQAQSSAKNQTILDPKNPGNSIALSSKEFEESVLVIQDLSVFKDKPETSEQAITINLVNFRTDRKFLPAYTINNVGYNDDGKHFDQVAGDGIFTSVKKVRYTGDEAGKKTHYVNASTFKYTPALDAYYQKNNIDTSSSRIGITCKIRTFQCPEQHWWDTCWPLSSPCTCIEFYDCVLDLTIL